MRDRYTSFLGEYECSSLALDKEERCDEEDKIRSLETRSRDVSDQDISIYRQEIPTVTGGGPRYIRGPPGEEYERELLEIGEEGVVLVGGGEGEDDIEKLKRGDGFSSGDVIKMKRSDYHILRNFGKGMTLENKDA
nr:hypothetical protein [Tanacetum cinerariifolium]GEY47339.1 hypothetical protein [Tanacetum cinerariifolium]